MKLRLGEREPVDHAHAGQLHDGGAACEQHARGGDVLHHVELVRVRPFQRVAAQPHDHDVLGNGGVQKQRRRDVGNRADGDDVQRMLGRILGGAGGEVARGGGIHRRFLVGQVAARALKGAGNQVFAVRELQKRFDLFIALQHAVLGAA